MIGLSEEQQYDPRPHSWDKEMNKKTPETIPRSLVIVYTVNVYEITVFPVKPLTTLDVSFDRKGF